MSFHVRFVPFKLHSHLNTLKVSSDGMRSMRKAAATTKYVGLTTTKPDEISSLLELVRKTAEDNGGMSAIAKKAKLSREALYRALSPNGNPTIKTLTSVLNAIGMSLTVAPISQQSMDDEAP